MQKYILFSLEKPEFWMGGFTVICIISVCYSLIYGKFIRKNNPISAIQKASFRFVSPTPNKPKEFVVSERESVSVQVLEGDSFWKISTRICGTGIYYASIQKANGYVERTLLPGDIISVNCQF